MIYFKPKNESEGEGVSPTSVPWEDVLKEAVYLALNEKTASQNATK